MKRRSEPSYEEKRSRRRKDKENDPKQKNGKKFEKINAGKKTKLNFITA